jgi:hypothetical protein
MTRIIGTVNDPGRVTATILAAVKGAGFDYAGEWDAETTYEKNKVVSIQSRLGLFKSLQAANTGNTPPASTDEWWEVVTAIPGGGVISGDYNTSQDEDIFPYSVLRDYLNAIWIPYYLSKDKILAPADVWTARATNGATFQVDETATNDQVKGGFVFSGTVSQGIQLQIKNLNNELFTTPEFKVKIHSKATVAAALNADVVWAVRGVWQGAAMDQAWSDPAILPAQALSAINAVYSSDWSDEVRITAPETLANGSLLIEIYRAVDEAGDKNENSAVILDVEILINQ